MSIVVFQANVSLQTQRVAVKAGGDAVLFALAIEPHWSRHFRLLMLHVAPVRHLQAFGLASTNSPKFMEPQCNLHSPVRSSQ
jgi:hypothetical protein